MSQTPTETRCLVCEELLPLINPDDPEYPAEGIVLNSESVPYGASVNITSTLRAFICERCLAAKGHKGLFRLVQTEHVEPTIRYWVP